MSKIPYRLEQRMTHRYVQGASHLDEWESRGTYVILNAKVVAEAEDFDDLDTIRYTVRVKSNADEAIIKQSLHDSLSGGGCTCEHDCCGHATWYARKVIHTKRNEWVAYVTGYRNY